MKLVIKKDEDTGELYLDFDELKHLFEDPSLVDSYSIEPGENDSFAISFFDINNNLIPVKSDA